MPQYEVYFHKKTKADKIQENNIYDTLVYNHINEIFKIKRLIEIKR